MTWLDFRRENLHIHIWYYLTVLYSMRTAVSLLWGRIVRDAYRTSWELSTAAWKNQTRAHQTALSPRNIVALTMYQHITRNNVIHVSSDANRALPNSNKAKNSMKHYIVSDEQPMDHRNEECVSTIATRHTAHIRNLQKHYQIKWTDRPAENDKNTYIRHRLTIAYPHNSAFRSTRCNTHIQIHINIILSRYLQ